MTGSSKDWTVTILIYCYVHQLMVRFCCGLELRLPAECREYSMAKTDLFSVPKLCSPVDFFLTILLFLSSYFECTIAQTNSKWFFQADVSSKKQTNKFNFTTCRLVFVRFFGRKWRHQIDISKLIDLQRKAYCPKYIHIL